MVTLTELKLPEEELEFLHRALLLTDCGKAGIFTGLSATDEQIEKYADAVFECSLRLMEQKPKAILLPIRGGADLGHDVDRVASYVAKSQGIPYHTYPIELSASGISYRKEVEKEVEDELRWLNKWTERFHWTDEERESAHALPRLKDLTIIDTAYTGMAYSKLLGIVARVLPDAKVNGIVAQDEMYQSDLEIFRQAHKNLGNGDFFYVRAPLIFEDQPTTFHNTDGDIKPSYIRIPTMGYSVAHDKMMRHVLRKPELTNLVTRLNLKVA